MTVPRLTPEHLDGLDREPFEVNSVHIRALVDEVRASREALRWIARAARDVEVEVQRCTRRREVPSPEVADAVVGIEHRARVEVASSHGVPGPDVVHRYRTDPGFHRFVNVLVNVWDEVDGDEATRLAKVLVERQRREGACPR